MKKLLILGCFFFHIATIVAQDKTPEIDFRIGLGSSILGSGDLITTMVENEFNLKFNKYFAGSISLVFGSSKAPTRGAAFWQGNGNLFISPFKNNQVFDLRFGGGFTAYTIEDYYRSYAEWRDGILVATEYTFRRRSAGGFNIIIETSTNISKKTLLGVKLFTQPYSNGDINSGVLFKLGRKLN